jgi:alkanesulfonate monooxygenase SsuD/methylene tetrahydromethanopterin reductase-like flavin-dependent oxidoreductase (luciferase family)
MRVGVLVLPTDPWPETVERARHLERLGYHHLWTYDHLSWRRYRNREWHAAIPWLTGVAVVTSTIRLGTMVATPTFRHPVTLAKEVMTLDHVSAARVTLGLGAGGVGFDDEVLGCAVPDPGARVDRFAEFVHVVDLLLRQPTTSYRGRHYTALEAQMLPGCLQQPRVPLVIGAERPRTLEIAARYADAWVTRGDHGSSESPTIVAGRKADLLAQLCDRVGRDPADIARIYLVGAATDERPLASVAAFTDFLGRYRDLGFTDVVFHHPRPDDPVWTEDPEIVERIGADVLPTLS